jgi:outer membrane protein OmpA-like peptidoglycan-associated protein
VDNLRNVGSGQTKDQVYDLLGAPHFNEGVFAVHVWNYLFNFRHDGEVTQCQYQIKFGKKMEVEATYWRDASCEDFLRPPVVEAGAIPEKIVTTETPIKHLSLRSDALFAFGQANINSISLGGQRELDRVVDQLRDVKGIASISIVGHTDRIGSFGANQRLSLARANAVKSYLVQQGIDDSLIHATGAGSSESVSDCPPGRNAAVIACLAPDRRVEIAIKGAN